MEYRKGYRNKSILKYFHILPDGYHPCPNRLLYQMEDTTLSISELCCDELKKNPIKKWMKQNNRLITITGMRREEGGSRNRLNCIIADKDGKIKKFHPLSPVSEDFENWYIQCRNIKLCRLYYPPFNFTRTGCKGCPYALDLQQELDIMSNLLPNEYKQCETLWKPVYDEYRKIGFRLRKRSDYPLLEN